MKKTLFTTIKIASSLLLVVSLISVRSDFRTNAVEAFVPLTVQFGNPPESPLFNTTNMQPGDSLIKEIIVTNPDVTSQFIAVKGTKIGPVEQDPPLIETILQLTISEGAAVLFDGTLAEFLDQSQTENGVPLSLLSAESQSTFVFEVIFPTTAGNEYQNKNVVFNIEFGTITNESVVINEVYYLVAGDKGYDSPLDRGIDDLNKNTISVVISENGAGSVNTVNVALKEVCKITQGNNVNISNAVNQNANTGNNTGNNIETGFIQQFLSIFNIGGINVASCGKKLGQNHEWIELYNTTEEKISLKNWTITDNSGQSIKLKSKSVKPGQFVIITKDSATWKYWNENSDALVMNLGKQFGDGLDNDGDHLYLRNAEGEIVDYVAWGNDTEIWDPAVPSVSVGSSIERDPAGFDTNSPSDWDEQTPPTPGY